jgi:hypothetical protein
MTRGRAGQREAALACVLLLSACQSTVQQTFGIGKRAPDEFQIVRRQPLIIPPDSTLRPPQPGEPGPQEVSTATQAREVLTGTQATSPPAPVTMSPGESALLADAKTQADPDIRRRLLEENTELTSIDESRFLMILDFQRSRLVPQPNVLNPTEESARLREQGITSTGPVTVQTGSTPLPASEP